MLGATTLAVLAVGATSAGAAGTATLDGTTVRYADPVGAPDKLDVLVSSLPVEADVEKLGGWRVEFQQFDPPATPGPGCRPGYVAPICPTGATVPGLAIDLGGGNDELEVRTTPAAPGLKATIAGGPGNDKISTYQTGGTIDGGGGDDLIRPDDRTTITQFPPEPTPGGVIRGGDGADTVEYNGALDRIDVSPKLRFRSKRISVKLQCPKLSTASCSGTLRLTSSKGKKLASKLYKAKRGTSVTVALKAGRKPARKAVLIVAPKGSKPVAGREVSVR